MIEPTSKDIGRFVVYLDDKPPVPVIEAGIITSFNETTIFVAFPKRAIPDQTNRQGCCRESLHWLEDLAPARPLSVFLVTCRQTPLCVFRTEAAALECVARRLKEPHAEAWMYRVCEYEVKP